MTDINSSLAPKVARLVAESDIRRLISAYSDAVWRKDPIAFADCWAPDAEWHIFGATHRGRQAIVDYWSALMTMTPTAWQVVHTLTIDVSPDSETALGRSHVNETVVGVDGSTFIAMGVYHDRYINYDGHWIFDLRRWNLIHLGPTDVSGKWFEYANSAKPPADPRPDQPTTPSAKDLGFA